jgi:hypothetical protein
LSRISKNVRPKVQVDDNTHRSPFCRLRDLPGWMVRVTRETPGREGVVEV